MYKLRVLLLILSSVFLLNSAAYADEAMAPKQPEDVKVETDAEKAKMQYQTAFPNSSLGRIKLLMLKLHCRQSLNRDAL